MSDEAKKTLNFAGRTLLRPVIRILLRSGMTFQSFRALAKSVFVEICAEEYGIRGRPANSSRIAIMTGLSRRDIKRLREQPHEAEGSGAQRVDRTSRVMAGWHDDPDFTDSDGNPVPLSEDGPSPSFADLFARYGGDVPGTAMLKELLRSGSVELTKDRLLVPRHRYYMPATSDPVTVARAATVIDDIGSTVYYNLNRKSGEPSYFEGRATNASVPRSAIEGFREFLEERSEVFLDEADSWLSEHQDLTGEKTCTRLGVGLYLIDNEDNGHVDARSLS